MLETSTMSMRQQLLSTQYPAEFSEGARNAVVTCLRIQSADKVTLITDRFTQSIAAALAQELEQLGCPWNGFILEEIAPRPLTAMPEAVLSDMESSQISIFAVQVQPNELLSRRQMTTIVNRRQMRHAHMVNITPQIMLEGMRADFLSVDRLSQKVLDKVSIARKIRATTAAGTDIEATFLPEYKWFKTSGIISQNKWGNLPGGEVFTAPGEVNGTFIVDGVVGDYLCARYGSLAEHPLTIQIKNNRITECHSANRQLQDEFWAYTHTDENSDRVGEFAIGTNIGVHQVIGNILQDENSPASTSLLATPTASTPARRGVPQRTSTWSDWALTFGWTMCLSWKQGNF